jgi:hypothetical protein
VKLHAAINIKTLVVNFLTPHRFGKSAHGQLPVQNTSQITVDIAAF